jgi:Ca2+:H+ antiporter
VGVGLAARAQVTLLTLSAMALIMPASFDYLAGPIGRRSLLLAYGAHLRFSLSTHKQLFAGEQKQSAVDARALDPVSARRDGDDRLDQRDPGGVGGARGGVVRDDAGVPGVIGVAVVGNAAEHSMAMKNRMEIAVGSSLQIALFVTPALVILSHFIGTQPMDLVFTPAEAPAVFVARGRAAAGGLPHSRDRVLLFAGRGSRAVELPGARLEGGLGGRDRAAERLTGNGAVGVIRLEAERPDSRRRDGVIVG